MRIIKNAQSGQAILMALILLALGSLLVVPLLDQLFTNIKYNQLIDCKTLNDYAADAGIQYAMNEIYNDPCTYTQSPLKEGFVINGRTVNVTAEYLESDLFSINSTAHSSECAKTTITSLIKLSRGTFAYVVAAKDFIKIEKSIVDSYPEPGRGNIYSNNTIEIEGPEADTRVNGDAFAVNTITGQGYITGDVIEYADPIEFSDARAELYETIAKKGGTHNGNLEFSGGDTHYVGPLYITGDLMVHANTTVILEGPIYVLGSVQVDNGHIDGNEHILCEGSVQIHGGGYGSESVPVFIALFGNIQLQGPTVDSVLYAPQGSIQLDNLQLNGALGGLQCIINNSTVCYTEEVYCRTDLPSTEIYSLMYSYE
jgi:hypothetical protein